MKKTYLKRFSPNSSDEDIKNFEIDVIGDPAKVQDNDDIDVKYYSEDSCKVVEIVITKFH